MLFLTAAIPACGEKSPTAPTCSFIVAAPRVSFGPSGGTGTAAVTSPAGCAWSAASQTEWIQVPTDARKGNGELAYTVLPSAAAQPRMGTITVAGQSVSLSQEPCSTRLNPADLSFSSPGGAASVTVDTQEGCEWQIRDTPAWVTFDPAAGDGPATVTVKTAEQTDTVARDTTISIRSERLVIKQAGAERCDYRVVTEPASVSPAGGPLTLRIETRPTCAWNFGTAAAWLKFQSAHTGQGSATLNLTADANREAPARQARVQTGDTSVVVTQEGQSSCAYRVDPVRSYIRTGGGAGTVAITTSPGCAWTAAASADWIRMPPTSGMGSAQIAYSVDPNATGPGVWTVDFRKAPIEIRWLAPTAGENAWLWQFGDCRTLLSPATLSFDADGGTGDVDVLVQSPFNCPWTIELPKDIWFTVRGGGYTPGSPISPGWTTGDGGVLVTVPPNPSSASRTAVIIVGEKPLTITQAGRR